MTLSGALHELLAAAKEVLANWEQGNLAFAVRQLDATTKKIDTGPEVDSNKSGSERFLVRWTIDAWAKTHESAAKEALENVRAPETTAVVFDVWRAGDAIPATIDLMELEPATEAAALKRGFMELKSAAKKVTANWERGDLAHAIRNLHAAVKNIEDEFASHCCASDQNRFLVSWEIDIWAKTHKSAAKEALACMQDPHTTATIFDVWRPGDAAPVPIDLAKRTKPRKRTQHPEP